MGTKLIITGGILRENGFELGEGKYYGCASLLCLNTDSSAIEQLLSIHDGNENTPDIHSNLEFTVEDIEGDNLPNCRNDPDHFNERRWLAAAMMSRPVYCGKYDLRKFFKIESHKTNTKKLSGSGDFC
ncbi:MAG: hypothetical protein WA435_01100 [Gallionellaceae bacterium]